MLSAMGGHGVGARSPVTRLLPPRGSHTPDITPWAPPNRWVHLFWGKALLCSSLTEEKMRAGHSLRLMLSVTPALGKGSWECRKDRGTQGV